VKADDRSPRPAGATGRDEQVPPGTPPETPATKCAGAPPLASPPRLWRLTAEQYAKTVATLFSGRSPQGTTGLQVPAGLVPPFALASASDRFSTMSSTYVLRDAELPEVTGAAADIATRLAAHALSASCASASSPFEACVRSIIAEKAALAFRRPAIPEEIADYVGLAMYAQGQLGNRQEALALALRAVLMAPQFLHRSELGGGPEHALSPYEVASAISFGLTDGPPDQPLWNAAADGSLKERRVLLAHVARLAGPLEANVTVRRFVREYFGYTRATALVKDEPAHRPELLVSDTEQFVQDVLATAGRKGFFEALLTTRAGVARKATAWSYGLTLAATSPTKVAFDGDRVGILGQPSWLSAHSQTERNDPILRGHFIREHLLCGTVPPIPIQNVPDIPADPTRTLREKLQAHVADPSCRGCHKLMDPLGLGFEGFDHYGRPRTTEAGRPVDRSGDLAAAGDADGPFEGVKGLATKLAGSSTAQACFVRHAFEYWLGRHMNEGDACAIAEAASQHAEAGGDLMALLQVVFTSTAFRLKSN
jgi:hypothetical protein